jgi:anti-sigma-K factor RskA
MTPLDPEERTVASGEYVLGTLTGAERERFRARLAHDPALQAEVGYWQDRLLALIGRIAPVAPSHAVWQRIDRSLVKPQVRTAAAAPTRVASPAPAPWGGLAFWRGFSGLAVAACLLLAWLQLFQPSQPIAEYVAILQAPDATAGWLVHASDRGPVKLIPLAPPAAVPADKSWQFWTKGRNAAGPTSLGLLPADGSLQVPRHELPDLGEEQLFEITLEPRGGSTAGRPTGPVLYVGKARRV